MCFSTPRPPKPPPLPKPVSPAQADISSQQDDMRRQRSAIAPRASSVITSPTGDSQFGMNVGVTRLVA